MGVSSETGSWLTLMISRTLSGVMRTTLSISLSFFLGSRTS